MIPPSPAVDEEPAAGAGNIESTPVSNTKREERTKQKHDRLKILSGDFSDVLNQIAFWGAHCSRRALTSFAVLSLCCLYQVLLQVLVGLLPRASPSRRQVASLSR